MESDNTTETSPRCCYICLETEGLTATRGDSEKWVSPCRCIGSTRWVHVRCVRRWVREVESTSLHRPVRCPLCLTPYTLLPAVSPVVHALHYWNRQVYAVVRMGVGNIAFVFLYYVTCISLGGFATCVVYGWEGTAALLSSERPFGPALLQWVGLALIALNVVSWEDWLLWGLRKASRLPLLERILPEDAPPGYGTHSYLRSLPTAFKEAALLPVCAKVTGELFCDTVQSSLTRALLGGLAFLLVKGGLVMFYKQKLMIRHKTMVFLPFVQSQTS